MWISVDVESDAESPAIGSMVCFGAVLVSDTSKSFYGRTRPITDTWNSDALAISGFSREEHEGFEDPKETMESFADWVASVCGDRRPIFVSDNPAFDWQWINFYFHKYMGRNPFGHSARRIGCIYTGLTKNVHRGQEWKRRYRKTRHDHNPVNDARGNAEALLEFKRQHGLQVKF